MYTTEFYENVKVTKPILLLSSFGGYISVLYKDKGISSVLPVYKLSMIGIYCEKNLIAYFSDIFKCYKRLSKKPFCLGSQTYSS